MRILRPLSLFLVSACAAAAEPPTVANPAETGVALHPSIAMATNSWGRPVSVWRVEPSGEGLHSTTTQRPGGGFHDYDIVTRRFSAGASGYARIAALLRGAQGGVGECEIMITDGLYGRIDWIGSGIPARSFQFNYGCQSPVATSVYRAMTEADALVTAWAAEGEIASRQEVRRGSSRP